MSWTPSSNFTSLAQRKRSSGGLRLIAIGVVAGSAVAALLAQRAASLLFKEPPLDPVVYAGVAGVLLLVAVVATWVPAAAAARVDPSVTLRSD